MLALCHQMLFCIVIENKPTAQDITWFVNKVLIWHSTNIHVGCQKVVLATRVSCLYICTNGQMTLFRERCNFHSNLATTESPDKTT